MADRESLFTLLKTKKIVVKGQLSRHFLGFQQVLEQGETESGFWLRWLENPAAGMMRVRSDAILLLRPLVPGACHPEILRSLEGVSSNGKAD